MTLDFQQQRGNCMNTCWHTGSHSVGQTLVHGDMHQFSFVPIKALVTVSDFHTHETKQKRTLASEFIRRHCSCFQFTITFENVSLSESVFCS